MTKKGHWPMPEDDDSPMDLIAGAHNDGYDEGIEEGKRIALEGMVEKWAVRIVASALTWYEVYETKEEADMKADDGRSESKAVRIFVPEVEA